MPIEWNHQMTSVRKRLPTLLCACVLIAPTASHATAPPLGLPRWFTGLCDTHAATGQHTTSVAQTPASQRGKPNESSLLEAAEANDLTGVCKLYANADPNAAQPDGSTALHWAAHHNNTNMVRVLLNAKANAKATNRYGVPPLIIASRNGNTAIVTALLKAGADPNSRLKGGESAIMTAARTGKVGPVNALIQSGVNVNDKERKGQNALMWAAAAGHLEVVQTLLKAKANRTTLKSGFTPILFAARNGHSDVVFELIKAGADINTPMQPARTGGKNPRKNMTALLLAVENGHFELAIKLIDAGADPNDQRSGYSPLHALTWVRKPNRGDGPDGDPAPRGTGKLNSLQFVREIVARGANVNLQPKRGRSGRAVLNQRGATPFLMAARTADIPLLKLLLELGADPHIQNADESTSLMAAAGLGTLATLEVAGTEPEAIAAVKLVLKQGADVNAVDKNGETAMHGAAYKSFPAVCQLLADNGADFKVWNKKNKHGWTPLLIAEGHRPGNYRPSFETTDAIHKLFRANGVEPPPPTPRVKLKGYDKR